MLSRLRPLALLAAGLVVVACSETPTSSSRPEAVRAVTGRASIEAGVCTDIASLLLQAEEIFGAGSPNFNSVRGKLENLDKQVTDGNFDDAKGKAHNIVDFVIDKSGEGGLPGTDEQIEEFANAVYCFSGLDITLTDLDNSALIFPSDSEQVVTSADGQTGVLFPANPVFAPTLITFQPLPDTYLGGAGPLTTKLDQYPGFTNITAQADAETILTQPATVGICAIGVIPADVRARLRLGHDASFGFEITPAAEANFITCPIQTADAGAVAPLWKRMASAVLPTRLHAYMQEMSFGGGVGGTVTEFSPFAPVDPELSFGGGVGGTVTEFTRSSPMSNLIGAAGTLTNVGESCSPIEAPVGTPVADACLPDVQVATRLGTPFIGVPITWSVTAGGGSIADRSAGGVCGTFASSYVDESSAYGRSGICWTLGAAGANQVTATPGLGGDAVAGVSFAPAQSVFDAIANPPVSLVFTEVPTSVVAGTPFNVRAIEVDKYGNRVLGAADAVTITLNQFAFAGGSASATTTAVAGEAVFTGLVINKAATGYTFTGSASFITPPAVPPTSGSFSVTPAAAAAIQIVRPVTGLVAPAGTVLQSAALVTDAFGNGVSGESVSWTAGLSSNGSVTPASSSTDAIGEAAAAWTLGDGDNQLRAALTSNSAIASVIEARGTSNLGVLNSCAAGGSKDPVNDPAKPYAFWIPDPGNGKTIRQVQLFFSSTGNAKDPTPYEIELSYQRATFDPNVSLPVVTRATVMLRGNNSENKMATFTLAQPIVGASGQSARAVAMRLRVLTNPDNTTITFNTGPCPPGKSCKVPAGCNATQVIPDVLPLGTLYRKSVGITVRGG